MPKPGPRSAWDKLTAMDIAEAMVAIERNAIKWWETSYCGLGIWRELCDKLGIRAKTANKYEKEQKKLFTYFTCDRTKDDEGHGILVSSTFKYNTFHVEFDFNIHMSNYCNVCTYNRFQTLFCRLSGTPKGKLNPPKYSSTPKMDRARYCTCNGRYEEEHGDRMLMCDVCLNWFHDICVNIAHFETMAKRRFVCPGCSGNNRLESDPRWANEESGASAFVVVIYISLYPLFTLFVVLVHTIASNDISPIAASCSSCLPLTPVDFSTPASKPVPHVNATRTDEDTKTADQCICGTCQFIVCT